MKEYTIRPEIEIKLTQEDIDDIMCASLEGGVTTYWCSEAEVVGEYRGEYAHEQISRGGSLLMHDSEEDVAYVLDLEKFLKGVKLWIEKGYCTAIAGGVLDTCDIDAADADNIVQLALFGDVIFG